MPVYLTRLPLPALPEPGRTPLAATNSIEELLYAVAARAPGTMSKGGERDLDASANFILQRWREGKMGRECGELDMGCWEIPTLDLAGSAGTDEDKQQMMLSPEQAEALLMELSERSDHVRRIDAMVARHFAALKLAERAGVATSARPARGAGKRDWLSSGAATNLPSRISDEDLRNASPSASVFNKPTQHPSDLSNPLMSKNQIKKLAKMVSMNKIKAKIRAKSASKRAMRSRGIQPRARALPGRTTNKAAEARM